MFKGVIVIHLFSESFGSIIKLLLPSSLTKLFSWDVNIDSFIEFL